MRKWWYNHYMKKRDSEGNKQNFKSVLDVLKKLEWPAIFVAILGSYITTLVNVGKLQEQYTALDQRIADFDASANKRIDDEKAESISRFGSIDNELSSIKEDVGNINTNIQGIRQELGIAQGKLDIIPIQSTGQLGASVMSYSYVKNDNIYYSKPSFSGGVVAVGFDNTEYSAEDLQNQTVIIPYTENGQEVFFQGQYNENNQWDGECLINVYKDGVFVIATEAVYDDGKRKEYQQLFPDGEEWVYSKRVDQDTFNGGDTWTYEKVADGKQMISFETPDPADMIHPADVKRESGAPLLSHYHGNTSDGKYNDDSGEAYLIQYFEDGYTKLVYYGDFSNGMPEDYSGDAWQIARNKIIGTDYMLFKGPFKEGKQILDQAIDWENPLTEKKMKAYTEGKPFEDELNFDMKYIEE